MEEQPDLAAAAIATGQHGVISRAQAVAVGVTPRMIDRRIGSGRWDAVHPGVYAFAGTTDDGPRRRWAAVLHAGPGCPIGLHTAGRLHGIDEAFERPEVAILVGGERRNPPPGVVWRRQIDLVPDDIVAIGGLPVTSLPRTAMDLASERDVSVTRLRRFVESAIVAGGREVSEFGVVLHRVRRSGKRGVTRMERVLDDLGPGTAIPHTELERKLDAAIALAGIPPPSHEHPLPGARDRGGFVDRCWPEARLIVEADGRKWHTRRHQIALDHERTLDAQVVGYQTSRLLWEHLHDDLDGSARRLAAIYHRRVDEVRSSAVS